MSQRQILRTQAGSRQQIKGLLESLFVSELLSPSPRIYLVSAWIRDIHILDNRSGSFRGLDPAWGPRVLRLSEILRILVSRGSELVLAIREDQGNREFARRLTSGLGESEMARMAILTRANLHVKGLLGEGYAITGSMNFTNYGVESNEELLQYESDPQKLAELRMEFEQAYGRPQ
ncbi:MAG: phospholipase D-like domain-containing protein DpdK [Polyangiaceae bacterium]